MEILDIHTHHAAPDYRAVVSIKSGEDLTLLDHQAYSIGFHPWDHSDNPSEEEWERLERLAARPEILAIGECGIDLSRQPAPMFRQLQIFRRHVELSERLGKPLIIHSVKAHDIIAGMRRDLAPAQNWVVHGFRQKPEVARMLLRAGCWLSFGPLFNEDTLRSVPSDRILAETDASDDSIENVILAMSRGAGRNVREEIERNSAIFLGLDVKGETGDQELEP